MTRPPLRTAPRRQQRGIAAILLVIFVGLALMVTVHGVFRAVRGAQEQTLAAHAQTPAQATAWNGSEALRRYLDKVDARTIRSWYAGTPSAAAPIELTLGGAGAANVAAEVTAVTKLVPEDPTHPDNNKFAITLQVTGTAGTGAVAAASTVEVIYDVELGTDPPFPAAEPPALNFFEDLLISGDVTFTGAEHAQVNVIGDVTITSTNLTGVEQINATGNVSVNSAVKLDKIHANGDVALTQGADSELIKARGKVLLSGGGRHGIVQANDTVTFRSSEAIKVDTRGGLVTGELGNSCRTPVIPNYDGTYIAEARVHGAVEWYSCGGGTKDLIGNGTLRYHGASQIGRGASGNSTLYTTSQHLRTQGNQTILAATSTGRYTTKGSITQNSAAHPRIERMCAQGNMDVPTYNSTWSSVVGYFGGMLAVGDARNNAHLKPVASAMPGTCDFAVPVLDLPEVPPYTRDKPVIDANVLKDQANIAFELDAAGELLLTVKALYANEKGMQIADGVYRLGYRKTPYKTADWLCRESDLVGAAGSGDSVADSALGDAFRQRECRAPIQQICQVNGMVSCFQHRKAAIPTWQLNSYTARTVARGVLWFKGHLKVGATGYLNTFIVTGDIDLVGNAKITAPNYAGFDMLCRNMPIPGASGMVESPALKGLYAMNFCNIEEGTLIENRMGNVALIAGSYDATGFSGGNIRATGGNVINGSVMAGNKVDASSGWSNTTIGGNVIGAGQGDDAGPSGNLGNTFNLNFPSIPGYNPGQLPCTSAKCMGNQARLRWARYR